MLITLFRLEFCHFYVLYHEYTQQKPKALLPPSVIFVYIQHSYTDRLQLNSYFSKKKKKPIKDVFCSINKYSSNVLELILQTDIFCEGKIFLHSMLFTSVCYSLIVASFTYYFLCTEVSTVKNNRIAGTA